MRPLYEIDSEIVNCIDFETGEVIDFERLEELQIERDKKIEGVAKLYLNRTAEAEQYKKHKEKFAALEKQAKRDAESIKHYLAEALAGNKFKTIEVDIKFRSSEAVKIEDEEAFIKWAKENRDDLLKYTPVQISAEKVKAAIKAGQDIKGAYLEKRSNIQIS